MGNENETPVFEIDYFCLNCHNKFSIKYPKNCEITDEVLFLLKRTSDGLEILDCPVCSSKRLRIERKIQI